MATEIFRTFEGSDNYVFIPACCYWGNQFDVLDYSYPPMFRPKDFGVNIPNYITNVPRLEIDGSGKIEVTTGDAATPCVGVFSPSKKRGILVFTVQEIENKNIGLAYEKGEIRLTWPAKREKIYTMCCLRENPTEWIDEPAEIPYKLLEFPCENLAEFYRVYFENRKIMGMDAKRPETLPFDEQFEIQKKKFNSMNRNDKLGIYQVGTTDDVRFQVWQPGWVGGAMSGYPLIKLGGEKELELQMKTLSFLFSTQCGSGFFHGIVDKDGKTYGDGFDVKGAENFHLVRKSADVLYFLFKHFKLMKERNIDIPEKFILGTKKLADGFVSLLRSMVSSANLQMYIRAKYS